LKHISSHEQHSFDKLHVHALKGSASLKVLHVQAFRGLTFKAATGVYLPSAVIASLCHHHMVINQQRGKATQKVKTWK